MESPKKAEGSKASQRKGSQNDSEDELQPPSPIDIATEPAISPEYGFPDAQELRRIESDTHNRLKAILEVAGVTGLSQIDARTFQDPEILRKLTNSVSTALDEAATALTRMKSEKQSYEAFLRGANQAPSPPNNRPDPASQTPNKGVQRQSNPAPQQSSEAALPPQNYHPRATAQTTSKTTASNGAKPPKKPESVNRAETPPLTIQPPTLQQQASDSMQSLQRLLTQGHTIQDATEDGESLLSLACSAGYYELAEVLLRMRASVEDRGVKGDSTPLMEAASGGYSDIVKLLIDHGANVNAKSSVGNTALTYACCGGYEEVVKILLNAGADVEHQNENGHTPLMEAASCGHVGVAKQLLEHGANINTHSNEFKESALTLACYKGHLEMVKFLLSAGADQEHKTDEMHTALMEASMDGHVDVARLLLDHGAQVNMPVDSFESPLTLAACGGHFELAALLLSRGADLEEVNDEGYTPLMEAAREGHEDVVQLLVEHGANVNSQTEETQETALTLACCGGFIEVAQYLIEHGADIELGASTPLMEAAQEGHVNIVRFLMEKGAHINAETNTSDTALTYACANGHTHIADILLKYGAELEHESEGGRTPLMKAARAGHLQTVQFLVSKGGNVNRRTANNDHTVLSLASAGGHISVVQYLLIKGATPAHLLRDNSTMLIEASRGGHANVANLLLRQPRYAPRKTGSPEPDLPTSLRGAEGRDRKQPRKTDTRTSETVPDSEGAKSLSRDPSSGTGVKRFKMTNSEHQQTSVSAPALNMSHSPPSTPTGDRVSPGPSVSTQLSHLPAQATHPPGAKDHPTAETIIEEYWKQRKSSDPGPSTNLGGFDNAQSMFSTGNFSTLPLPGRANEGEDPDSLSNVNLTRLIPTLEALAGSLRDPNSLESRYLAALATHSQLGEQGVLTNGIDSVPTDAEQIPVASDTPALLSGADLASLLPSLANFDPSSAEFGSSDQPIYPSSYYHAMKQLSERMQSIAASVGQDSVPGGEKESSSVLLDSNFPIGDIPPPESFVPPDNLSGYEGSGYEESIDFENDVEITAYPTSEEDLGNEEDDMIDGEESDTSYAVPDFSVLPPDSFDPAIDIEQETESNHDTALTLAAAGGHDELVELLLAHGANIEHRDKKGCTALILAASAGHAVTVAILLDHNASIEAQSDRTKDTALSLACSGGRQEVVELLLAKGANFEHRNVSDYTPLSLAASGGYVNIIKLLLRAGADINSRTGSKLGISPLMLASMNGHTSTVKLLLDMGSDINAQIETNRNTALTLACFQGRHEVVLLLVERQANVEHRAKTGLTPLMEAASGGYHEVGKVLIAKSADVNAAPVPSSKDTALTIAADKGHFKFVELILRHGAWVDVKNKKGNSPLWLTCNGGHLDVVRLLVQYGADVDSQDNRKISSLMVAFKRGHLKVVKFLVEHVAQFPSDAELTRYIANITDKDLLKKCQRCMEVIIDAKDRQAAEANKNATSLLLEIDQEKKHEEDRKAAAARKRAKKKRQKEKKQALKAQKDATDDKEIGNGDSPGESPGVDDCLPDELHISLPVTNDRLPSPQAHTPAPEPTVVPLCKKQTTKQPSESRARKSESLANLKSTEATKQPSQDSSDSPVERVVLSKPLAVKQSTVERSGSSVAKTEVSRALANRKMRLGVARASGTTPTGSPRKRGREDGWKEVGKRAKKVTVPSGVFSQVVGKNNTNLHSVKQATNTQIEVDKVSKQTTNRSLTIRGSTDAVKLAHQCITSLSKDPTQDLAHVIRRVTGSQVQKRSVPPPSDPTTTTSDPYDELPAAPPATGSSTPPAFTSLPTTSSAHSTTSTAKPTLKKSSSSQMISTPTVVSMAGSNANKRASTTVTAVTEAKPHANLESKVNASRATVSAHPVLPSSAPVSFSRTLSTGSVPQTATSGPVRKLFVAPSTQPGKSTPPLAVKIATTTSGKLVRSNSKSAETEQPKVSTTQPVSTSKHMSYSRVISSQESRTDAIEQPVQQILKTPTIFQEPATQLSKPRKISTYSDAVGKRHQGGVGVEAGRQTGGPQGGKLSLAPGSRLTTGCNSTEGDKVPGADTRCAGVWVDVHNSTAEKTSPDYSQQQSFEDESKDKLSPPNSSLGPIGPPVKSAKSGSTTPALKNRSYSPAVSKQITSPAVISASPQRSELSPAAKSPLLGSAPPGLLPPPDKGYGNSFRPIQQLHNTPSEFNNSQSDSSAQSNNSNFQTLVPTPVRNQRPPLLATPPGLSMIQGTPVPSPEKNSPNKSPPHIAIKGFNPNAPSFVPMALQSNTRPNVPTTSSILGAPPAGKFPGFVAQGAVAGGSSILGQPQMPPMYAGGSNSQPRMVSPVPSIFPSQPPPNVIQPPQPAQPPQPSAGQTSILGQPPPIFGPPIIPQGFSAQPPSGIFTTPQIESGGNQTPAQPVPPHFGINIIPFQVNGQQQPSPNFITGVQPTQVLVSTPLNDAFQVQADSQQQSAGHSVIVSGSSAEFQGFQHAKSGESMIDLKQIPAGLAVSGQQQILFSAATHSSTLPITASAPGARSSDNLFNLSLDSFSGLYPSPQPQTDASDHQTSGESMYSKAPKGAAPGEGLAMDGLAPIGTERAQKTSAAPPYAVLTPGILPSNVWSYSGTTATEDSDWSKLSSGEIQWPSLSGHDPSVQDSLESVLERLGLLDYHSLLERNEIDLNALVLMGEQDFAEIGLPPGPRQALLLGIGRLASIERQPETIAAPLEENSPRTGSVSSSQ